MALLRESGSVVSDEVALDASSKNLFTVLRNWRDQSEHEHRLDFVNEQLAEILPQDFRKFDFQQAAQRQSASVVSPLSHRKEKLQPTDWSDGFFCTLVHLAALASVAFHALHLVINAHAAPTFPAVSRWVEQDLWSRQMSSSSFLLTAQVEQHGDATAAFVGDCEVQQKPRTMRPTGGTTDHRSAGAQGAGRGAGRATDAATNRQQGAFRAEVT